jgi:hypothetical protein
VRGPQAAQDGAQALPQGESQPDTLRNQLTEAERGTVVERGRVAAAELVIAELRGQQGRRKARGILARLVEVLRGG